MIRSSTFQTLVSRAVAVAAAAAAAAFPQTALAGDPFEWRVADGGNGHWYQVSSNALNWGDAAAYAISKGGHLATFPADAEWGFVRSTLLTDIQLFGNQVWAGGFQPADACEPLCGWQWVTGEPWKFADWHVSEPNNSNAGEDRLEVFAYAERDWADSSAEVAKRFLIEWDADCNGDGAIDYGQIAAGQLPDANANNIPDSCECSASLVLRVPQDVPSIADAVARACTGTSLEVVLSPGSWPMAIDTDDPAIAITIRGVDKSTCIVTSAGPELLLNGRYGSTVVLRNLTVADVPATSQPAQAVAWDLYFDGCVVRDCSGSFLFESTPSPRVAAVATRFERCTGPVHFGALYFNGAEAIDGCEFVDCVRALCVWGDSTITNCTFVRTTGHAVQARAPFTMSACSFSHTNGHAVLCLAADPIIATISQCQFLSGTNSAINDTHLVPADQALGGTWTISGSIFQSNSTTASGGAIRVGINRAVTLSDTQFVGNSSSVAGGAFAQAFGGYLQSLAATNCTFTGNTAASGHGGALMLAGWSGQARLTGSSFSNNRAKSGGAIRCDRTRLDLLSCVFDSNSATEPLVESGGAIFASFGAGVASDDNRVRQCTFRTNTGAGRGGAVAMYMAVTTAFEDCVFESNSAGVLGGALAVHQQCAPAVRRCRFTANSAGTSGSAFATLGTPGTALAVVDACRFSDQPANAAGARAVDAQMRIELSASSFCASGLTPFGGEIAETAPNCVATSCADEDADGIVDECEGVLSAVRVPVDYPTIQSAIDAIPAGTHREILVLTGVYNESFSMNGKDIVVRGVPGGATILDGTGLTASIARFSGGEPATAGLQDLVFRNGGAGSVPFAGASFRVGGALFASDSAAFVRRCAFSQNRSGFGGAIYFLRCQMQVEGSTFLANSADDEGGAMLAFESSGAVRGCEFRANACGAVNPGSGSGFKSVGARVAGETVLIDGCRFVDGIAGVDGAAVEHFENPASVPGLMRIANTEITGNQSGIRAGGLRVLGRMQSCTIASGTVICGNSNLQIEGPYFIEGAATVCDCLADVARDGSVNGGDIGLLLNAWGLTGPQGSGDANHDGLVNAADIAMLLSNWGGCP